MKSDSGHRSPRTSSERQRISILRKAFEVYDVDGSGAIDYDEFRRLLDDLGWPSHEEFLRRAVRVLDQDMSGEIEFSEFQKWTEFAYASRILYRHEMYGSGPRYESNDNMNLQPVIDKPQSGRRGLVIRRASLKTVLERPNCSTSSDEDNDGFNVGPGPAVPCSMRKKDNNEHRMQNSYITRFAECPQQKQETTSSRSDHDKVIETKRENNGADELETPDLKRSVPVKEVAEMVLTQSRRGRGHTSRSRSKSVGILCERRSGQLIPTALEEDNVNEFGPRTESKMTVRMRWACGQFKDEAVWDDEQGGLNDGSPDEGSEGQNEPNCEGPSKTRTQPQPISAEDAERARLSSIPRRHTIRNSVMGSISGNREGWQDLGLDLRRIQSD